MITEDVIKAFPDQMFELCGSRVTCIPPPANTDCDYLVQIPDDPACVSDVVAQLELLGFRWEGDQHYQCLTGNFMSFRRDNVNLIVTRNAEFAARHRVATSLCTRLNLMNKPDRIAVFQAVLYSREVGRELTNV